MDTLPSFTSLYFDSTSDNSPFFLSNKSLIDTTDSIESSGPIPPPSSPLPASKSCPPSPSLKLCESIDAGDTHTHTHTHTHTKVRAGPDQT